MGALRTNLTSQPQAPLKTKTEDLVKHMEQVTTMVVVAYLLELANSNSSSSSNQIRLRMRVSSRMPTFNPKMRSTKCWGNLSNNRLISFRATIRWMVNNSKATVGSKTSRIRRLCRLAWKKPCSRILTKKCLSRAKWTKLMMENSLLSTCKRWRTQEFAMNITMTCTNLES